MRLSKQAPDTGTARRSFLKAVGLLGAGAAATAAGLTGFNPVELFRRAEAAGHESRGAHQWVFVMDLRYCDGCDECIKACQKMHYLPKEQTWIRVYEMEGAGGQKYFMPRTCQMCENPPCQRVCPVGATYTDAEGIVLVDQDKCIGCRICMAACPYEARYFNFEDLPPTPATLGPATPEHPVPQQKGTVGKCVFCVHNLRFGKIPYCIESCTMGALYVGDRVQDIATNGAKTVKLSDFLKEHDAVRYKEELNTKPRVYYILGHGQNYTF